jgi:hypothetical protein
MARVEVLTSTVMPPVSPKCDKAALQVFAQVFARGRAFLTGAIKALRKANQRRTERELSRLIDSNGGHLTDDIENLLCSLFR